MQPIVGIDDFPLPVGVYGKLFFAAFCREVQVGRVDGCAYARLRDLDFPRQVSPGDDELGIPVSIVLVTIASPFPDNCSGTHHERLLWRLHPTLLLMARTVEPSRWFMVMEEGCTSNTGGALSSSLHAVAKKKLVRAICNTCLNFVLISVNLNKYKYTHKYGTFA